MTKVGRFKKIQIENFQEHKCFKGRFVAKAHEPRPIANPNIENFLAKTG